MSKVPAAVQAGGVVRTRAWCKRHHDAHVALNRFPMNAAAYTEAAERLDAAAEESIESLAEEVFCE